MGGSVSRMKWVGCTNDSEAETEWKHVLNQRIVVSI